MKHRLIALTVVFCLSTGAALAKGWEPGTWAANTGALSYSFFNLSGESCNIVYPTTSSTSTTANPAGANPYAAGNPAQSYGWNSTGYGEDDRSCAASLFKSCGTDYVSYTVQGDPVQAPVTIGNGNVGTDTSYINIGTSAAWSTGWTLGLSDSWPINGSANAISNGTWQGLYEGTAEMNQNDTAAATADSFWVLCGVGSNNPSQAIMMANVASASDSFNSGEQSAGDGVDYNIDTTNFYPQASGPSGPFETTPTAGSNANGANFVADTSSVLNYSVSNSGGLWSAIVNQNINTLTATTQGGATVAYTPANYNLVPAMFPVNLSNYVTASSSTGYTDIYGGHFTLAIGDPFIVSSYNAKILWYLASQYALTDSDFTSASGIANMISALTANPGGVFGGNGNSNGNGNANTYVSWLFGSASQAAAVAYASIQNATNSTSTEAFWGKLLNFALGVTMKMMDNYVSITNGVNQGIMQSNLKRTTASTITGQLQTTLSNPIAAWATTTTTNTPTTQNAPMMVNSTFSASNLLGMLLTNVVVQSQLNSAINTSVGTANPLWANYTMYFGTECVQSTVQVNSDFFPTGTGTSGVVQCNNSSNVATNLTSTAGAYENVCSGWSASNPVNPATKNQCGSDSGTALNLWNAVLGGTDLSPNSAGTELQTVSPSTSSFQPPTLVAATGVTQVNTDFNLTSGILTFANYSLFTAPASQPTINSYTVNNTDACTGSGTFYPLVVTYDSGTGLLTSTNYGYTCIIGSGGIGTTAEGISGQTYPNGPISLNMNTCAAGSAVQFNAVVTSAVQTASFSCVTPQTPVTVGNTTLDYNLCVNDPNATGGVLILNLGSESSPNPALACACIPAYIGGAQATSGTTGYYQAGTSSILLGATSASPGQQCAAPNG